MSGAPLSSLSALLRLCAPPKSLSLFISYLRRAYSEAYRKTGVEQFSASLRVASSPARLTIWDLGGHVSLRDVPSEAHHVPLSH